MDEASGTVELKVNVLSGVLTETITLSYVVSDVSTTVSEDYTVTLDMLMLSLETPSVTIKVAILDDDLDEVDEMFTVTLRRWVIWNSVDGVCCYSNDIG